MVDNLTFNRLVLELLHSTLVFVESFAYSTLLDINVTINRQPRARVPADIKLQGTQPR